MRPGEVGGSIAGVIAFEDLPVGRRFNLGSVHVDREEMLTFNTRFDPQPFHLDEDAARDSLLGGLCASGWFTASLWMRCYVDGVLAGSTSLGSPGGDEIAWPAPVFPGDDLTATMEILGARVSASRPQIGLVTLLATMTRSDGHDPTPVFRARFTGLFGRRHATTE